MNNKLRIIWLIVATQLCGMEQLVSEQKLEPSQIFLGEWENNTSNVFLFKEDYVSTPDVLRLLEILPSNPDQNYKKFLGIKVKSPRYICDSTISRTSFYIREEETTCGIIIQAYKKKEEQEFVTIIRIISMYLSSFGKVLLEGKFNENLRIFIHGKIVKPIDKSVFLFSSERLPMPSLKDFAINAVLKNKLPTHNFQIELIEAIDDFKIKQKEKHMQFYKQLI